jgi:hypothetical protein
VVLSEGLRNGAHPDHLSHERRHRRQSRES